MTAALAKLDAMKTQIVARKTLSAKQMDAIYADVRDIDPR